MSMLKRFIAYNNQHWEVWPIVIFSIATMCLNVAYPIYHMNTRKDYEFYKDQRKQHWIRDLENPNPSKFIVPHKDTWLPDFEMAKVYRDMAAKEKELQMESKKRKC